MNVLSVCSARPNFVKLAAVHHAVVAHGGIRHVIVHTGQHYDPLLSDVFFRQLDIPQPDANLGVHGGTREEVIEKTRAALVPVLEEEKPDWVLAYGDVNGAVGAALAAKECGIRIAHVEAGLRSRDLDMPEERNRIAIDEIADLLLCSERSGMENVAAEKRPGRAVLVGNTMIDTFLRMRPTIAKLETAILRKMPDLIGGKYAIATLHRPSNVDNPDALRRVMELLLEVARSCPVTVPAHPRLQRALDAIGFEQHADGPPLLILPDPLPYLEFLAFLSRSAFILTDSGGIQEEAVLLGKRCFTLRRSTERPSTIAAGSNVLIDPDKMEDRAAVLAFAKKPVDPAITVPEFWDGKTGARIVEELLR